MGRHDLIEALPGRLLLAGGEAQASLARALECEKLDDVRAHVKEAQMQLEQMLQAAQRALEKDA